MSVNISLQTSDGSRRPKSSTMIALPLKYLNGWLFAINANRVKPEVKEVLMRYQRECYDILHQAFSTGVAVRPDDELMQSSDPAAIGFRNALATARLARQHYYLTKQVDDNTRRIGLIEAQLTSPAGKVTQAQAQQIASAVKTVAMTLAEKFHGNHFGRVYAELYKRYSITEYKMLPAGSYDDAIEWLTEWHESLNDG